MYTTFLERMQTLYKPDKIKGLPSRFSVSTGRTDHR